jgi:arsenate reductase
MKTILFVCTHNAGRSQMAEAFFNEKKKDNMMAISSGTNPATQINPIVAQSLKEKGIDISKNKPKLLTPEILKKADIVISMGCGADNICPAAFVPVEDWGIDNPEDKSLEQVRTIRDEIENRVDRLLTEIN